MEFVAFLVSNSITTVSSCSGVLLSLKIHKLYLNNTAVPISGALSLQYGQVVFLVKFISPILIYDAQF